MLQHSFLDQRAAFPSGAHDDLFAILAAVVLPTKFINAVRTLYKNNVHEIKLGGRTYPVPIIKSGVRQGCPLSMILFALCIEPLIRVIIRLLKEGDTLGSFADDIAIVMKNPTIFLPILFKLFETIGAASGLLLNVSKCTMIPLAVSADPIAQCKQMLCEHAPGWKNFNVALAAEYLGFWLGPASPNLQWNKIIRKAREVADTWSSLHLGFFYNTLACNIYILSLFSYVGQLATANSDVDKFLKHMTAKMFAGPGNWIPLDFLCSLKLIGMPVSLRNLSDTMYASKVRVAGKLEDYTQQIVNDLLLSVSAFNQNHGTDHSHAAWHANALGVNVRLAEQQYKVEPCYLKSPVNKLLIKTKGQTQLSQKKIYQALDSV